MELIEDELCGQLTRLWEDTIIPAAFDVARSSYMTVTNAFTLGCDLFGYLVVTDMGSCRDSDSTF